MIPCLWGVSAKSQHWIKKYWPVKEEMVLCANSHGQALVK